MRSHRLPLLASLLTVLSTAVLLAAPPASAAEVYPRPPGANIEFAGRAFGHGRGMSQWGAYGAAAGPARLGWRQILDFYYPGTVVANRVDAALRVRLDAVGTGPTTVAAGGGLTLTAGDCRIVLPDTSSTITYWRVRRSSPTTFVLEYFNSAANRWYAWAPTGAGCPPPATTADWTFGTGSTLATSVVRVLMPGGSVRSYRGWLRAVPNGSRQRTVNVVALDDYLKSVVPSEMPASWPAEALRAQTVAARTYAARTIKTAGSWDICDTTACQVYSGTDNERSTSTQAVEATRGVVLTYQGAMAFTEFSAYNGGWTTAGSVPYQVAKRDPYDGVFSIPARTWRASATLARVEAAYPQIGALRAVRVLSRDGNGQFGGRVGQLLIVGSLGSVREAGDRFRGRFGLRSSWFTITNSSASARDFNGDGLGDVLARDRSSGTLYVYSGNGAGGISTRSRSIELAGYSELMMTQDFDGDGRADMIARRDSSGELVLFRGNGAAGAAAPVTIGTGWGGYSELTAATNLDGDGRPDIVAKEVATGRLYLYRGDGRGGWLRRQLIGTGWRDMSEVASVGDWDGDGKPDLLARSNSTGRLYLFRGNGRAGWLGARVVGYGWTGMSRLSGPGDWDGDRNADVMGVETSTGTLYAYRGNGRGGWLPRLRVGPGWSGMDPVVS